MLTLIVPGPHGKSIRITANDTVTKTLIAMIMRSYRDNECRS